MQSRKESNNVQPYALAAKMIIDRMKTPARFTEFLTECITWISDLPEPKPHQLTNANFTVTRLINGLNVPLFSNDQEGFEKGFNGFLNDFGPEGYHDELGIILEAFGKHCVAGYPGDQTWEMYSDGLKTLLDLYPIFQLGWKVHLEDKTELKEAE